MLDFSRVWLPFIYLYGLGGILFIAGIVITIKAGSFDLGRFKHKKWMWVLLFGFVWYLMMHACLYGPGHFALDGRNIYWCYCCT